MDNNDNISKLKSIKKDRNIFKPTNITIYFKNVLERNIKYHLIVETIKYLLFIYNQIPSTFEDIENYHTDSQEDECKNGNSQNARKR